MAINPANPSVLYAGTGEGFGASNLSDGPRGLGVFQSINGGETWNLLASTNPAITPAPAGCGLGAAPCPEFWFYLNRIAISPDGNTILAATNDGVARSTDGGVTWTQRTDFQAFDVKFDPSESNHAILGEGPFARFSTDGGQTWTFATFPTSLIGVPRIELAYAPSSPNIVYASVPQNGGQVYRSTDGGHTYTLVYTAPQGVNFFGTQGTYDNVIWVNPQDPNFIIFGGVQLGRSTTCCPIPTMEVISGSPIEVPKTAHPDQHVIVAHPGFNNTTNRTIFVGNDGGLYRADDVAAVQRLSGWTTLNNGLGITQFYGAAGNPQTGVIIGGTQDNGTVKFSGTPTWTSMYAGDGGFCAADPTDSTIFYGEEPHLGIYRSTNGGMSASRIDNGISDANNGNSNFIAPFILDPNDPNTMLAGALSLWRSSNVKAATSTWTAIKPPTANNWPISAIAVSSSSSDLIVVGHNDGQIYITSNGTSATPTWKRISDITTPARFVTRLVIDHTRSPNWIYAMFGGFNSDNIYVSKDLGTTWSDVSGVTGSSTDLPSVPVRSLAINPANNNFIYAGTEVGIFASEDAGATWSLPQDGPANVSVDELFWLKGDLVAATYGRGVYKIGAPRHNSLSVTGSGFYGLSPSEGSFGRTTLSPQVTQVTPIATVRLTANGDRQEDSGFAYRSTLVSDGTAAYGGFIGQISLDLSARPQTATISGTEYQNYGHSELEAHLNLSFSDAGFVTSDRLPFGTPVTVTFTITNKTSSFLSEPEHLNLSNPYPNGNYAYLSSNGYIQLFDENSQASIDPGYFLQNKVTSFPFNTAVGNLIDLKVVNSIGASAFAGYIGLQGDGSVLFYEDVQGRLDTTTEVTVQAPAGVSFIGDSGYDYITGTNTVQHSLGNISTRGLVGTGDNVMIGGFIISGSAPKRVMLRGLGPTLAQPPFNIPGVLNDPTLELHGADGSLLVSNDNWTTAANAVDITASGYAPPNPMEAAILVTLSPASYTAILRGTSDSTGVAIFDCYDLDTTATSKLTNISTRGFVQTGGNVMIAGLVVSGPGTQEVLVRGLGPTLNQAPFNVPNVLADPFLDLRDANGTRISTNDNWKDTQEAQIQATGRAPPNNSEAAILSTLLPGNYTAILSGVNNTAGNALVEVYALD